VERLGQLSDEGVVGCVMFTYRPHGKEQMFTWSWMKWSCPGLRQIPTPRY